MRVAVHRLLWALALVPVPALAAAPSDDFLDGYISAVLERETAWPLDSYRVEVINRVATVTLYSEVQARRGVVEDKLAHIEGLQGVDVAAAQAQPEPGAAKAADQQERRTVDFPTGDLFRPLIADPKQPRFFMSVREYETEAGHFTAAAVGYGETFGLKRWRGSRPNAGWQLSLAGGLLAQFNFDAPSFDLINADYMVGVPLTYRWSDYSARLRFYHQSSHLGDEFLLRTQPERVNLSYEALEALASYRWRRWRVYGGGEYLVRREPEDLDPEMIHTGLEYYGQNTRLAGARLTGGIDLKSFAEHDWRWDVSVKAGLVFGPPDPGRRHIRLLAEYYKGFSPHGQFYTERIEYKGMGLSFGF